MKSFVEIAIQSIAFKRNVKCKIEGRSASGINDRHGTKTTKLILEK
jgi:hypothetical protein